MYPSKMTVFYNKRTGDINTIATGEQSFSIYGTQAQDFELILDLIIVDFDMFVISNYSKFVVNINTKILELKPDSIPQYPIAVQ